MNNQSRVCVAFAAGAAALLAISGVFAQSADPNSAPNPYKMEDNWAKLPDGRKMGAPIGVEVDRDGKSVWVFDRCGANDCGKSNVAPIMKFDPAGKFVTSFGGGMFNFPHGLGVDREGNVYVTDERGKNGKGAVLVKFSPDGKVLLTIGKPGMPGDGEDTLDGPSDVVVAPNGDIYVADGHGGNTNDRIVKFSKDASSSRRGASTARRKVNSTHRMALPSIPRGVCCRRSRQQPGADLRCRREIPRRVEAVRPAEQRGDRQERCSLRRRLAVGCAAQRALQAGHPDRQREGRNVTAFIRCRPPRSERRSRSRLTIRASSMPATPTRWRCAGL